MKQKINFIDSWKFYLGDLAPHKPTEGWGGTKVRAFDFGAVSETVDDSKWCDITLPHDYVMEGDYTQKSNEGSEMKNIPEMESIDSRHFAAGSLEGGVAWYRKHFSLAGVDKTRVYVCFDGVYRNSDVYVNQYYVGTHTVVSPSGEELVTVNAQTDISSWDNGKTKVNIKLSNAELWDIEKPVLYTLVTKVYADGCLCEEDTSTFGIRTIYFDNNKGFFLNGRHVKIKGLCCHHDHAGVGIGMTKDIVEYRMKQLKSMGANAFRNAHYMTSTELLEVCDRPGILVFDETRRMSSAKEDIEALRTLVKHGRNHPCVFLWGIGNEEVFSQDRPETERTTLTMKAEVFIMFLTLKIKLNVRAAKRRLKKTRAKICGNILMSVSICREYFCGQV